MDHCVSECEKRYRANTVCLQRPAILPTHTFVPELLHTWESTKAQVIGFETLGMLRTSFPSPFPFHAQRCAFYGIQRYDNDSLWFFHPVK